MGKAKNDHFLRKGKLYLYRGTAVTCTTWNWDESSHALPRRTSWSQFFESGSVGLFTLVQTRVREVARIRLHR